MWLPHRNNFFQKKDRFIGSLVIAAVFHGLIFLAVVFTVPAVSENKGLELVFWGGVLQKGDVAPRQRLSTAMKLTHFFSMPQMKEDQHRSWSLAVANEKDISVGTRSPNISIPEKFIGSRVIITHDRKKEVPLKENDPLLDEPRIPLRLPW